MKSSISIYNSFIFLFIIICPNSSVNAQAVPKPMAVSLAVTTTGINRFVATQWSSITTSWSGSYRGITYTIDLARPSVSLLDNEIKISLTLDINSSVYNNEITIEPRLTTPTFSTSTRQILTSYDNLRAQIDAVNIPNSDLEDLLEDLLEPIDWVVYEGGILDALTGRVSETSDLKWEEDTSLDFAVAEGELLFTVTPTIVATSPMYTFKFRRRSSPDKMDFEIRSNNKISLDAIGFNANVLGQSVDFRSLTGAASSYDQLNQEYVVTYSIDDTYADPLSAYQYEVLIERASNQTIWKIYLGIVSKDGLWKTRTDTSPDVSSPTGD